MQLNEQTAERLEALEEEIGNALVESTQPKTEPAESPHNTPAKAKFLLLRTSFAKILEDTLNEKRRCEQTIAEAHEIYDAACREAAAERDAVLAHCHRELEYIEGNRDALEMGLGRLNQTAQV